VSLTTSAVSIAVQVVAGAADDPSLAANDVAGAVLLVILLWFIGDSARRGRELAMLEARAEQLARDREEAETRAVAKERARIARELHDVVAHSVTIAVVQASAAQVLPAGDSRVRDALLEVERTGREALVEIRRLLGLLRADADPDQSESLAPRPTIGELDALADQARRAGLPVELVVVGTPRPLAVGIELSAYRIVQEALTNCLKHAGKAKATVTVCYQPRHLEVKVTDEGGGGPHPMRPAPEAHGLIGMRERVGLLRGTFEAGPMPGGGFAVVARLPTEDGS
jgi:signal transduction histidine kinase